MFYFAVFLIKGDLDNINLQRNVVDLPSPPIGIIDSLAAGFEMLVTDVRALVLLLPPLLLDMFLWLGPRLSIERFARPTVERFFENYTQLIVAQAAGQISTADMLQELDLMQDMFVHQVANLNVFGALITAPLGVPSLMGRVSPDAVPEGIAPGVVQLNPMLAVVLGIALAVVGFFFGAFYLGMIAQQVRNEEMQFDRLLGAVPRLGVSLFVLALIAFSAMLATILPFVAGFFCVSAIMPSLGLLVFMIGLSVAMWTLVFLFFAPHAMLLAGRSLFSAIGDSLRVVRANSSSAILFLILVVALYFGLSLIFQGSMGLLQETLSFLSPDSWLWLVSLIGHAFIATGLFAATFVYYQDRYRHYEELRMYFEKHQQ